MEEQDDFVHMLDECINLLDENLGVLNDIEYSLESEKEDVLVTDLTRHDLVDMAYDVSDSTRIKKAESEFTKRFFETKS